jgi:ribosomal protein S27E
MCPKTQFVYLKDCKNTTICINNATAYVSTTAKL